MTFSKTDLVDYVSEQTGLKKAESQKTIEALFTGIIEALAQGKDAKFIGFGSFTVQKSAARAGFNPRTREPIAIKASNRPTFKAGSELKAAVNG